MVRNYNKSTKRQEWSAEAMSNAMAAVISGQMGYLKASNQFDVPQTTLERYVKKKRENPDYQVDKTEGKFKNVFTNEQEQELVTYLQTMDARLFGLTIKDLRYLAYQLAERNGLHHRFKNGIAGEDWAKGFLKRNSTLSIRKPESTSGARAMGFNKVAVDKFFSLFNQTIDKHKLTASTIYNCDETSISVNPKNQAKVIARRGKRQVGSLTSAERGETVTSILCMSAAGAYMPPMLIFPRKKKQKEFELGLPPGAWSEVNVNGWMTIELFIRWFKVFVVFSNATKKNPVLLILDGHSTHTKNLEVIDTARDNGVVLLCLPPHCSHRLQPLDVSFMKPLSLNYAEELRIWLRCNPGKVVTLFQISTLFGAAFIRSATMKTAINGFKSTGIWPPNPNVFSKEDFLPADTTDIRLDQNKNETPTDRNEQVCSPTGETAAEKPPTTIGLPLECRPTPIGPDQPTKKICYNDDDLAQPGCSWKGTDDPRPSSFNTASPEIINPIPIIKETVKRKSRRRGKTAILTESPYKNGLQMALQAKEEKQRDKEERARQRLFKKECSRKGKQIAGKNITKKRPKKNKKETDSEESEDDSSDCKCLFCSDFYSTSTEGWVACSICKKWAHNSCAGIESEDDETVLICEFCQN